MQEGGPSVSAWTTQPPPPGPAPGIAYAGFWIRTVAFVIDFIVVVVVGSILGLAAASLGAVFVGGSLAASIAAALVALAALGYFVASWVGWGRTPGMAITQLQLVRAADGGPIHAGRAILRYATLPLSFAIIFLGVIWVGFDRQKQGWHDRIAGTLVVRPVRW